MADLIDRDEAISALVTIDTTRYCVPCKEVLKAIRELPSVEPNVHELQKDADCISRQATIDYFVETIPCYGYGYEIEDKDELRGIWEDIINKIPSAEPQITHQYCAKVLKKLWDDEVILFCEYDRIMDRLKKRMEVDNDIPR